MDPCLKTEIDRIATCPQAFFCRLQYFRDLKFDLKSMSLQISTSRTPKKILVSKIHQNDPHTCFMPFDPNDLACTHAMFLARFSLGAFFLGKFGGINGIHCYTTRARG